MPLRLEWFEKEKSHARKGKSFDEGPPRSTEQRVSTVKSSTLGRWENKEPCGGEKKFLR